MNQTTITLVGNVATSPERHRLPAGDAVTRFRVASSPRRFDRAAGKWQDGPTSWYSVSVFRGLGEHAFSSLSKGDRVVLAGRLRIREWESGDKRGTDAEVEVDAVGHDLLWGTTRFESDAPARGDDRRDDEWSRSATTTDAEQPPRAETSSESDPASIEWATATPGEGVVAPADTPF